VPQLLRRDLSSPVGPILAGIVEPGLTAHEPGGVCLLELGDTDRRARELAELESYFGGVFVADTVHGGSSMLDRLERELGEYFDGSRRAFSVPICAPGTRFQHEVWNAMRRIPFGETTTYGGLARSLGRKATASRAVGLASGRNRVSLLIPCHRVVDASYDGEVGSTRGLRGYGGGLQTKQWLLEHEQAVVGRGLFSRS